MHMITVVYLKPSNKHFSKSACMQKEKKTDLIYFNLQFNYC